MTPTVPSLVRRPPAPPARPDRAAARDDAGWQLVTVLLGPVAARNPDVAMALVAGADEVLAAGRARWRRCASVLAASRARS